MATKTHIEWRDYLEAKLALRAPEIERYENYYNGDHDLRFATRKFKQAFGHQFREFADNFCQKIVDTPVDRLKVEGFRFGATPEIDAKAWTIWKANRLGSRSNIAHSEASKSGVAYVLVDPYAGSEVAPRITIENALNCIVESDPADSLLRLAGLKKWKDADGFYYCNLFLPDVAYRWVSKTAHKTAVPVKIDWVEAEIPYAPNPLGSVPLVPLENNPSLYGGTSDLKVAIPLQNALNKEMLDMLVASEYLAYPARVATGVEVPVDENDQPIKGASLEMSMSGFLMFEDKDAKVSTLSAADLSNWQSALDTITSHMSAQTSIPAYELNGSLINVSAETIAAAENSLVNKIKRKQGAFAETWQEVMRLSFLAVGDEQAAELAAEVAWKNPELHTLAQKADAAVKFIAAGVPYEFVWADVLGLSPEQVAAGKAIRKLPDAPGDATPAPNPIDVAQQ